MKMTKKLDDTFNITPTEIAVDESEVVVGVDREKPDRLTKDDIEKDYEYTRGNLYSIIEKGQEAIYTLSLRKDKKQLMEFLNLLKRVKCQEHMKLLDN